MKLLRTLIASLALVFSAQVHAASLGEVQTGQGSWPTVLAPDINDDLTNLYATPLLTIGNHAVYSTERAIAAGTCLTGTDGGANSSYTFGITGGCIGTTQIGTDGVDSDEIAADAVGISEMGDDSVGINELDLVTADTPNDGDCLTYDAGIGGGSIEAITCPGAGGGITNLSEDTDPELGGALDTAGFAIEFGNAQTDTSVVRSSAGNISVEGNVVYRAGGTDVPLADGGTGASLADPGADRVMFWDDSAGAVDWLTLGTAYTFSTTTLRSPTESFCVAASDEATDLTTGTAKVTWRMPYPFTLTSIRGSVNDAAAGTLITVDVNEAGTSIMTTNKLTIDIGELTSTTAATAAAITDPALDDEAEMKIDIDGVGTTAKGLKVCLIGYQT